MASLAIASAVAAVGGTVMGAVEKREQGIAMADDAKMRSRQAGLEAGQKAIQNRQNMLRALASQNAAAGVAGIGTGGPTSFGANVNRQISQQQNDLLALSADTSATQQQYAYQAENDTRGGILSAGSSLLDSASSSSFQNTVGAGAKALGNLF